MSGIGLSGSLYMGAQSLTTQRLAMEVVGNNLSNANTTNAARQRANIVQSDSIALYNGQMGTGSYVYNIQSLRSALLDKQVVRQTSLSGYYDKQNSLLSLAETAIGDSLQTSSSSSTDTTSSSGIQSSLQTFYDSLQSLQSNPDSMVARNQVLYSAGNLTSDITAAYGNLLDLKEGIGNEASSTTDSINTLLTKIANYNSQISKAEVNVASQANDLRDQRQQYVEELSQLVNITVTTSTDNDSMIDISLTDDPSISLVKGKNGAGTGSGADATYRLDVVHVDGDLTTGTIETNNLYSRTNNSRLAIIATNSATAPTTASLSGSAISGYTTVGVTEGQLGAQLSVSNDYIGAGTGFSDDTIIGQLNTFADNLMTAFNTIHTAGYDRNGIAGGNFFTTTSTDPARSISVAITDGANIAAATTAGSPLDSSNLVDLLALRDDNTIGGYYKEMVGKIGTYVSKSKSNSDSQGLIQQQLNSQREAVSGISVDEEMTDMLVYQRAFQASAQYITTIDEMLQTVLNIT